MGTRSVALKIARAEEHLASIQQLIDSTRIDANNAALSARFDSVSEEAVLYIAEAPDLTDACERASVLLGDCLHNLRSALDHLLFELAIARADGPLERPWDIQFPLTTSPSDFASVKTRRLTEIDPEFQIRIEALQPYPDRTNQHIRSLGLLRDLSNREKHRTLVSTSAAPQELSLTLRGGRLGIWLAQAIKKHETNNGRWALEGVAFKTNEEIVRCESPFDEFDTVPMGYIRPHFKIESRNWLLPTVRSMTTAVRMVVELFPEINQTP